MKIVVIGAGGVGGYFGGLLAQSGQDVTFIARGEHLETIRQRGLQVKSVHGDFRVELAEATDDPIKIGSADLILIGVKDFQLDEVIAIMEPLVNSDTAVLPLLNGIQAAERLSQAFGRERVLGGLCSVVAYILKPGVIQQTSPFRRVAFGEWDGQITPRAQAIYDAFRASDAEVELSADVHKAMWTKFLFITAYSGVASVVRLPVAGLHACSETMEMMRQAMEEIEAVGRAKGVALDEDIVEKTMAFVERLPPETTASMQRDVEAGRLFEMEALTGSIVRYGIEEQTPTPVNRYIYAMLKPQEIYARQGL